MSMISEQVNRMRGYAESCRSVSDHVTAKYLESAADTIEELAAKVNSNGWIPITFRPMTEDEKPWHEDCYDGAEILDCPLPDDGQEVLITVYGGVEVDTFIRDEVDECYFENRDIGDVKAWMPLPPAWKGENDG